MHNQKDFSPPAYDGLGLSTPKRAAGTWSPSCARKSHTHQTTSVSSRSYFSAWFSPSRLRVNKDAPKEVQGLMRDLVLGISPNGLDLQEQLSIALSAAVMLDRCSKNSPAVDMFLQEEYINSHSPLFWAIVKGAARGQTADSLEPDLLDVLLSRVISLKPATITEMRTACRIANDQATFHRLCLLYSEFSSESSFGVHHPLLIGDVSTDEVSVEQSAADCLGAFVANIQFPHFHRRLMISGKVAVEFVAENRIWYFACIVSQDDGRFMVSLYQQKPSPQTPYTLFITIKKSQEESSMKYLRDNKSQSINPQCPATWTLNKALGLQYADCPYIAADKKLTIRLHVNFMEASPSKDNSASTDASASEDVSASKMKQD